MKLTINQRNELVGSPLMIVSHRQVDQAQDIPVGDPVNPDEYFIAHVGDFVFYTAQQKFCIISEIGKGGSGDMIVRLAMFKQRLMDDAFNLGTWATPGDLLRCYLSDYNPVIDPHDYAVRETPGDPLHCGSPNRQ